MPGKCYLPIVYYMLNANIMELSSFFLKRYFPVGTAWKIALIVEQLYLGYVYTSPVQFSSATFLLWIKCVYTVPDQNCSFPVYTVPDPFDFLLRACAQQVSHCMQGRRFALKSRQNVSNVCLRKRRHLEYIPHIELQCVRCE